LNLSAKNYRKRKNRRDEFILTSPATTRAERRTTAAIKLSDPETGGQHPEQRHYGINSFILSQGIFFLTGRPLKGTPRFSLYILGFVDFECTEGGYTADFFMEAF